MVTYSSLQTHILDQQVHPELLFLQYCQVYGRPLVMNSGYHIPDFPTLISLNPITNVEVNMHLLPE